MDTLGFSPEADAEWEQILDRDRPLAEAIDPVLDEIEADPTSGRQYDNHARFRLVRVRGRSEDYIVIWEVEPDGPRVLRIGRSGV